MTNRVQEIAIIEDDANVRQFLAKLAERASFTPVPLCGRDEVEAYMRAKSPSAIVMDLHMPGFDGIEVLRFLSSIGVNVPIVLVSGFDERVLASARRLSASLGLDVAATLTKPIDATALEPVLRRVCHNRSDSIEVLVGAPEFLDQLRVCYQPKVTVRTPQCGALDGFEALVRWEHPGRGLIGPDECLPIVERLGLIKPLTFRVIEQALNQLAEWTYRTRLPLNMAINLSASMLDDEALPDEIAGRVAACGIKPERIMLEVTETAVMADPIFTMQVLTRMRLKGFKVSIDDFGTGYSSMVELYQMPFSELKIDRSFVRDLLESKDAQTIVRLLTDLAHGLGLTACVEGVESERALEQLREFGVDTAQGFYISAPLAPGDFDEWYNRWRRGHTGLFGDMLSRLGEATTIPRPQRVTV